MSSLKSGDTSGWKPKILLCGRTGSGKSSIANMLIKGHLKPPLLFPTSSGVRGKTLSFQREESEDFVIVDTVGFGEAQHGSVVDEEARNMLYDFFVKISQDSYNYFAYVHKWGKLDNLDSHLWAFFKRAFVGAEKNFVIIFTHCSPTALEENLEDIKVAFKGCERYITVDFPAVNDPESSTSIRAKRSEKMHMASLGRLRQLLAKYMLPARENLCMRSNLTKGRILLMGSDAMARNMVAKLLVGGNHNLTPNASSSVSDLSGATPHETDGNQKSQAALFEELEGRRWLVVNTLVLDKESTGDIFTDVCTKEEARLVASKAVTMLASEFLTILHHGSYSHFIYVEDCRNRPVGWESVLQEITKILGTEKLESRSVALSVNSYDDDTSWPEVSNRFREWGTVCQVQLRQTCESPDMERKNHQHALDIIEEALDGISPYGSWDSIFYNRELGLSVDPCAFEALVYTSEGLQETRTEIDSLEFGALNLNPRPIHFDTPSVKSTTRTVFRSHVRHVAAEISCLWKLVDPVLYIGITGSYKPFRQGLHTDFIWGELQVVDKHHVDRKIKRLPLTISNCKAPRRNDTYSYIKKTWSKAYHDRYEDFWHIGLSDAESKEFTSKLLMEDTIVLWMNPHPSSLELLKEEFKVHLSWGN